MNTERNRPNATKSLASEIQRNVDAHTDYCKYWELFHGNSDEILMGATRKELNALKLLDSTANSFQIEHYSKLNSRSPRYRTEGIALRAALRILRKAQRQLNKELSVKLNGYLEEHGLRLASS